MPFPYQFGQVITSWQEMTRALQANFLKVYTKEETDAKIAAGGGGGGSVVDASTTVKGVSKLSVAPVSPTDPIAVGNNDSRLSDSRTPNGSAGGSLAGSYPNPTIAAGAVSATEVAASLKPSGGAASGTEALRAIGTTASTAAAGNDARLSDARTPTGTASGSLAGTYPSPTIASSVSLPGSPTTTTQTAADNSTKVATTAYTDGAVSTASTADRARANHTGTQLAATVSDFSTAADTRVQSAAGTATPLIDGTAAVGAGIKWAREDHVHPTDTSRLAVTTAAATYAPLASPAFTGNPTAPTPSPGDNDTSVATTAFVTSAVVAAGSVTPSNANPLVNGTAAPGVAAPYSREDHVHPTDTSRAALASPTFTGTPAAPTATAGTSTTQLATTAFVTTAAGLLIPRSSFTAAQQILVGSGSGTFATESRAIVTALPGSPVDGQQCYYQNAAMATAGVVWHLRYRTAVTKWESVGQVPLISQTASFTATSGTYAAPATGTAPSIVVPLVGTYDITTSVQAINSVATATDYMSASGAGAVAGTDPAIILTCTTASGAYMGSRTFRKALTAGSTLTVQALVTGGTGTYTFPTLELRPVFLG